jgi:hypothetical protein
MIAKMTAAGIARGLKNAPLHILRELSESFLAEIGVPLAIAPGPDRLGVREHQ